MPRGQGQARGGTTRQQQKQQWQQRGGELVAAAIPGGASVRGEWSKSDYAPLLGHTSCSQKAPYLCTAAIPLGLSLFVV